VGKIRTCIRCNQKYEYLSTEIVDENKIKIDKEQAKYCPYCRSVILGKEDEGWLLYVK
jgi:DNA-directed RNA polymerase subunit RPC12/RpoP